MKAPSPRIVASKAFSALPRGPFAILFAVSLITAVGNTGMQSVLPAIGREIGIPDSLVAAIFSLSALLWAVGSPVWARLSDQHGRRPLIMIGMAGFIVSMLCCALVVSAGVRHLAAPMVIFFLFLFARALFGLFGAAATPASQAYLVETTTRENRTRAIASLAGAFGLGTIIGPAVAPLFVLPVLGLAGPMFVFAFIAAGVLVWVVKGLPESHTPRPAPVKAVKGPKPAPLWRDPRVKPFLIYGVLVASCQTAQYQTLGFMIIDKLGLPPMQAQGFTAVAMMAGAVAGLLAQWGLISMFRMGPKDLLRWGVVLAAGANLITAFAPNYLTVVVGFALASLGYGFARPGFTAGASLAVRQNEQARAAGAIGAINGLNVIAAPLFVLLYQHVHAGPFILNVAILGAMAAYALINPMLRNAGEAPTTEEETASSALERNSGGSGF